MQGRKILRPYTEVFLFFEKTRTEYNGQKKQHEKNEKQNFCNRSSPGGYAAKSKYGRNNCNDKENKRIA